MKLQTNPTSLSVWMDSDESFAALKWALGGFVNRSERQRRVQLDAFVGYGFRNRTATRPGPKSATTSPTSCVCGSTRPLQASTSDPANLEAHLGEGLRHFGPAADRP